MKFAGCDHIIVYRRSRKLVHLWIDDKVEPRDGQQLLGLNVRETDEATKRENDETEAEAACVGPAGEDLVNSAHHAAGAVDSCRSAPAKITSHLLVKNCTLRSGLMLSK